MENQNQNQNQNVPVVGKYKVAWWSGGTVLDSKMFDSLDAARLFMMNLPKGTVSTIMKRRAVMTSTPQKFDYSWEMLSDGAGKFVPAASWVYKNRKTVGYTLAAIVAYRLIFK